MNGIYGDLLLRYPALEQCGDSIRAAAEMMLVAFRQGGKMLV